MEIRNLSEGDRLAFLHSLKQHEEKARVTEEDERAKQRLKMANFNNPELIEQLKQNREKLLKSTGFSTEDREIVEILKTIDTADHGYLAYLYAMVSLDYKIFIEKSLDFRTALNSKFTYIFGADLLADTDKDSKTGMFYHLSKKLYDMMEQCFSISNYENLEMLNNYLSIIGSMGVPVVYQDMLTRNHFVLGFKPVRAQHIYCFVIPPSFSEHELFKALFRFYNNYVVKVIFDAYNKKHSAAGQNNKLYLNQDESLAKRLHKLGDLIEKDQNVLSLKLASLKRQSSFL